VKKFELYNPVRMVFGAGEFERLGELASEYGSKPLVVVGQYFAKESGLLDRAIELLTDVGLDAVVFEGVEPNPRLTTCQEGARMAAENECDMVIGIGGGSVMDASKTIAFGFYDPDAIWRYIAPWEEGHEPVEEALPIILVSTLAATGSEGDSGAVITNWETKDKIGVFGDALFAKVSIVDPKVQATAPIDYTRDGAIDMAIHVLESYFNGDPKARFSDRITEGFFIEVMEALEAILAVPEDLEARSQLAWLGATALHGFINRPRGGTFPLHMMQHPLSGHFDVSHGRGLALLLPRWLKYVSREKPKRIIEFGDRVFGMDLETHHPHEAADKVIKRIADWLRDVGAYFFMDDLGIPNDPAMFERMAEDVIRVHGKNGVIGGLKPLEVKDIVEIYRMCVRTGSAEKAAEPEAIEEGEEADIQKREGEGADVAELSDEPEEAVSEDEAEIEVVEEVIELGEGEELPEGVEGEEYVIVEEVVEEEETQQ